MPRVAQNNDKEITLQDRALIEQFLAAYESGDPIAWPVGQEPACYVVRGFRVDYSTDSVTFDLYKPYDL